MTIEQKIRDQFSQAIKRGTHWVKMLNKNLPKSKEVLTLQFVGRGRDSQGHFLMVFHYHAEGENECSYHRDFGGIKHFMTLDMFKEKYPDLFDWLVNTGK